MCLFIETICYDQGQYHQIDLHNERCNRTRNHFFGTVSNLQLELFLAVPSWLKDETVKCKVTYGTEITGIEYGLYKVRPVESLQLVIDDEIDYAYKYADRTKLSQLYQLRDQADDILIVKNGYLTDTSYANIILKKDEMWYSPQYPLLHGTRIESYFRKGVVTPALLRPEDLPLFSEARIVNSMISIENSPVIPLRNIKF